MDKQKLPMLPPKVELETKKVLKQLARANRALAELKGYADTIPNKNILINAVMINESKDSSEIENIITTHDDLYKAISAASGASPEAKEVVNYRAAMWQGYSLVKQSKLLTTNTIIEIQGMIENSLYTPPEGGDEIKRLLNNLEKYINKDNDDIDPLIKLAVIHYQFESIHPFYDGNGRTGRIINILYLVLKELLDSPILYLSGYIIRNKADYYKLLQEVRIEDSWEEWIVYILTGVEAMSEETLKLVKEINGEVKKMSLEIKEKLPKIYSKELISLLFFEFYTKIVYIEGGLGVTRKTAASYLAALEKEGFLVSEKIGKERIYKNKRLADLIEISH